MDDAFVVGGGETERDVLGALEGTPQGQGAARETLAQRLSVEQFGDSVCGAVVRAEVEDREDVGV